MRIELLKTIPISGTVRERHFDVSGGANAWVAFDHEDGTEWVGVFGAESQFQLYAAIPFGDDAENTALVVAGGQGYIVDLRSGELVRRTPWSHAQSAITIPDRPFVLVADDIRAWATSRTKDATTVWRRTRANYDTSDENPSRRLALNGIIFERATNETVFGRVWDVEGWHECLIDVATLEFTRGKFLTADYGVS